MQKTEHVLWRGIVTAITAAAMFVLTYRYSYAEEISGGEVYFTHSHVAGCKTVESVRCSRNHSFWLHRSEKGTYHCSSCNAQTTHNIETDVHRCADTGDTWQENSYTQCSICGTIHSTWGGPPGDTHFYNKEKINCGLSQGERTSGVKIVADGAWTNQGVILEARRTVLKNDSSGSVTFSWDGGTFLATENGTYTVSAVNGAGASVTASIEISCIDKTAPVILSVSGDTQGMTASSISISVVAEDGESGLAEAPYSFDGGATWTVGSSFRVEEGQSISLRVRDKAGNMSEKIVKRGDFPYPPPAPTPPPATPAPVPSPTAAPQPSDTKTGDGTETENTGEQTSTDGDKGKDGGESVTGSGADGSMHTEAGGKPDNGKVGNGKQDNGKGGNGKPDSGKGGSGKTDNGKDGSGKSDNGKDGSGKLDGGADGNGKLDGKKSGGDFRQARPQPAVLKEDIQEGSAGGGFRVVRMDKAQAAGMTGIGTLAEGTETMAAYMQAVTAGTRAAQDNGADGKKEDGGGARYALTSRLSLPEGKKTAGTARQALEWIKTEAGWMTGAFLLGFGMLWGCRLLWLYSAELYCYDGGNEYRRLGSLHIRKRRKELELYLPDYILTKTGAPRYRLVIKSRLVKRCGKMDLVVYSDEHRLRRSVEECVDFVL